MCVLQFPHNLNGNIYYRTHNDAHEEDGEERRIRGGGVEKDV